VYNGIPIIYGCGDFVDDYAVDSAYRNNLGPATHTHTRHVCVCLMVRRGTTRTVG
jgi:hypothetical protein